MPTSCAAAAQNFTSHYQWQRDRQRANERDRERTREAGRKRISLPASATGFATRADLSPSSPDQLQLTASWGWPFSELADRDDRRLSLTAQLLAGAAICRTASRTRAPILRSFSPLVRRFVRSCVFALSLSPSYWPELARPAWLSHPLEPLPAQLARLGTDVRRGTSRRAPQGNQ